MGATPTTAGLLLAFLALVVLKFIVNRMLALPSTAVLSVKEGSVMRANLLFAAALDTVHGLGANGWVSYLLSKMSCAWPNPAVDPAPSGRWTLRDKAAQRRSPLRWASK